MMFDWNDHDEVGGSIWSEFSQNEDHIVPYPKDTGENRQLNFGDYSKKQRIEEANSVVRPTGQASGVKSGFPARSLENSSNFNSNADHSALDMHTWPDMPALDAALGNGYCDSVATGQANHVSEAANVNKDKGNMTEYNHCSAVLQCKDASAQKGTCSLSIAGTVQLDSESGLVNNEHGDKEQDDFLYCDWATIGDFDDLDRVFRNDNFFWHNMIDNVDESISPSSYVISSTSQSIPMPDILLNSVQSSDQGCLSFQFAEQSCGKREAEEKEDRQKKLLSSQKKAEKMSKNKSSMNVKCSWSRDVEHSQLSLSPTAHPSITWPEFQSPTICQQRQIGNVDPLGHGSYNHSSLSGYGYPTFQLPAFPPVPHIHGERNQIRPGAVGNSFYQDSVKHSHCLAQVSDELPRPLIMTTQEKIDKLRRRQKIRAILAIQKQQQKLGHRISVTDNMAFQASTQESKNKDDTASSFKGSASKLLASDINILAEHDELKISPFIHDQSLEETIYYQLQDALGKLNAGIRFCVRDSLFRLARSALERQSASDRSSTDLISRGEDDVPANKEYGKENRYIRVPDEETDTNPIDRMVIHLLYHRLSDSSCAGPVKEETPQSCNPDFKLTVHPESNSVVQTETVEK